MFGDGKARYVYTKHWTRLKWQAIRLWTWKSRDSRLLLSVELHIQMLHTKDSQYFTRIARREESALKRQKERKKSQTSARREKPFNFPPQLRLIFLCFRFVCEISWDGKFMINNEHRKKPFTSPADIVCEATERAYSNHVFQFAHFTHCTILISYSPESRAFPTNRRAAVILCVRCRPSTEMWERSTFAVYMVLNSTKSSPLPHEIWVNFLLPTQCARAIYINWNDSTI